MEKSSLTSSFPPTTHKPPLGFSETAQKIASISPIKSRFLSSHLWLSFLILSSSNLYGEKPPLINIKKISPEETIICPSNGMVFENIGFVHGHRWPGDKIMQCEQIIIGHTHPNIMLTDRLGYKTFEPCWIKGKFFKNKLKEKYPESNDVNILVTPAFNPLCGGIAVNCRGVAGPIGRIMDVDNSEVYLLDGSFLGKVKNIK